ncbi:MAG: hypothetical protein H0W08_16325 [Acidobacteria bacterium]|nr:hypothetical protein [Acidobacteriota bacterium]
MSGIAWISAQGERERAQIGRAHLAFERRELGDGAIQRHSVRSIVRPRAATLSCPRQSRSPED